MSVAASVNFGDLLDPRFKKIFADEFRDFESMRPMLYDEQTSDRNQELYSSVSSLGDFDDFEGTVSYDNFYQGYDTTITPVERAKGFKIERKLWDDDQHNIMNSRPKQLALAANRTRERHAASVFNNAFDSSYTGGDSLSLCNSAHTSTVSGVANQSNTGTTALSATEVEVARRAMIAYQDLAGNYANCSPDLLLVPTALEETAWEIIESTGKVDTANNNKNFHYGKYKLAVWHNYLTDSNNWFLIDSKYMKMFLVWLERIPIEFNRDTDFDTLIKKWMAYMRYGYGFTNWLWIYGENVS